MTAGHLLSQEGLDMYENVHYCTALVLSFEQICMLGLVNVACILA